MNRQNLPPYSVLMSVYYKEKPEFLQQSIESMLAQTIKSDDFVLVCDGPLTPELDNIIEQYDADLHIVRLPTNSGLGNALNEGLKYCKHDIVARMDSDDISLPQRCEKELELFADDPSLCIVSGALLEFFRLPQNVTGSRRVPATNEDIRSFSKRRSPFNHVTVMLKKSEAQKAGGYSETYPLFEDYSLWVRMLQNGCRAANLVDNIVYVRVSGDMYRRRGGIQYARNMMRFRWWMYRSGWSSSWDFCVSALPQALICVMPNGIRTQIYQTVLRK